MPYNDMSQLAYSIASSGQAQDQMRNAGMALLNNIEQRTGDAATLVGTYFADGVSDAFQGVEKLWQQVGDHVHTIMAELEKSLGEADGIATTSMSKAQAAVDSIRIL